MANTNSSEVTSLATTAAELGVGLGEGKLRSRIDTFTYASQVLNDTLTCRASPAGWIPVAFGINTDTTTATATLAIGISGTAAKYHAATAYTTTNRWTFEYAVGASAANYAKLGTAETVILTVGTTVLPSSGYLLVMSVGMID